MRNTVNGMKRYPHDLDDDACCIRCGIDMADVVHLESNLRMEIGEDEFNARKSYGEFSDVRVCRKHPEFNKQ